MIERVLSVQISIESVEIKTSFFFIVGTLDSSIRHNMKNDE